MKKKKLIAGAILSLFLLPTFVAHFYMGGSLAALEQATLSNPLVTSLQGTSCKVALDSQGIPHVSAKQHHLLLSCLGYLHGRDRGFQVDLLRRTFQGRQAEILGTSALKTDMAMRLFGLEEIATRLFYQMSKETQNRLWSYAFGLNQGLSAAVKNHQYEFEKFSYVPEPWFPWQSVALLMLQSFDQTRKSFEIELKDEKWLAKYPLATLFERSSEGLPWDTSILKTKEYSSARGPLPLPGGRIEQSQDSEPIQSALHWISKSVPELGQGSNNWVVKSKSAWLANDPHLGLKYPSFWYWVHLQTFDSSAGDFFEASSINAIGASLPGVPSIASGTNLNLSWGLTNAFMDVADLAYIPWQELDSAHSFRPLIWINLALGIKMPFFFKSLKRTLKGYPVLPVGGTNTHALVLRWVGFELTGVEVEGVLNLYTPQSVTQMEKNLKTVGLPAWNVVFADTQGQVGYRVVGRVPKIKDQGSKASTLKEGMIPKSSLKDFENSWVNYLTSSEMPHALNPARNFLVTANNRHWPRDHSQWRDRAYSPGFRAFRIEEKIKNHSKAWTWEDHAQIQCDVQSVDARFFVPLLLPHLETKNTSKLGQLGLETLRTWDFEAGLECKACGLYRRMTDLVTQSLEADLSEIFRWLKRGDPRVIAAYRGAFQKALTEVSDSGALKPWRELHLNSFTHLAGASHFSKKGIPTPGDEHSVNPGVADWKDGSFEHKSGASHRLIVEMSQPPKVYSNLPGMGVDLERPDLSDPSKPWARWSACQFERRFFPWDWDKNPGLELFL